MAARGQGKRKGSLGSFYSQSLGESEKRELEEASNIEGIDQEIALLRLKLRQLLQQQPGRIDLHFEAANTIARLVKIQYQITREQQTSLKEAIQKVLTEVAVPLGIEVRGEILGTTSQVSSGLLKTSLNQPECQYPNDNQNPDA